MKRFEWNALRCKANISLIWTVFEINLPKQKFVYKNFGIDLNSKFDILDIFQLDADGF